MASSLAPRLPGYLYNAAEALLTARRLERVKLINYRRWRNLRMSPTSLQPTRYVDCD